MALYVDLYVDQGANFSSNIIATNASTNAAINIASYSFTGRIKKSHFTSNVADTFICTKLNSANGVLSISLPSANTANIEQGRYVYSVKMTTANGSTSKLQEGSLIVLPDV